MLNYEKLIKLSNFVSNIMERNYNGTLKIEKFIGWDLISDYNEFIQQQLELYMFLLIDSDGDIMEEYSNFEDYVKVITGETLNQLETDERYNLEETYQEYLIDLTQAKEKLIFKNVDYFEQDNSRFYKVEGEQVFNINVKADNITIENNSEYWHLQTIEDIINSYIEPLIYNHHLSNLKHFIKE